MISGVLITRPIEASSALAANLRQLGYQPVINPLLRITELPFDLPRHDAVLVTSAAAVRPLLGLATRTPFYAVGRQTCDTAIAAGFVHARCIGGTVEEAAEALSDAQQYDGLTLLYASGVHVAGDIAARVRNPSVRIVRVPVYDTHTLPLEKTTIDLLYAEKIGWILLFSRRTAESLAMAMKDMTEHDWMKETRLVCISTRTAEPLVGFAWKEIMVAARPESESLIAALPRIAL